MYHQEIEEKAVETIEHDLEDLEEAVTEVIMNDLMKEIVGDQVSFPLIIIYFHFAIHGKFKHSWPYIELEEAFTEVDIEIKFEKLSLIFTWNWENKKV